MTSITNANTDAVNYNIYRFKFTDDFNYINSQKFINTIIVKILRKLGIIGLKTMMVL